MAHRTSARLAPFVARVARNGKPRQVSLVPGGLTWRGLLVDAPGAAFSGN